MCLQIQQGLQGRVWAVYLSLPSGTQVGLGVAEGKVVGTESNLFPQPLPLTVHFWNLSLKHVIFS